MGRVVKKNTITPFERAMVTFAIMTSTVMQALDTTIANVALPHMQGKLGVSQDQISWVVTSYILSSAITMALAGTLANKLGRKRLFLISIFGFTASSALCGLSGSINSLVVYRFAQGIFGASFVPLSQSILLDIYPKEKHGAALALWGAGIMVGPILGPILGGYITEVYGWQWVFFVNMPVGLTAFVGLGIFFKEHFLSNEKPFDWSGFFLLSIFLTSLQLALDRGEHLDWFSSKEIKIEFLVAIISFYFFILHSLTKKDPFLSPALFKDKNLVAGLVLGLSIGATLQATLVLMPEFLQQLMNYPVEVSGFIVAPRGVGTLVAIIIVKKLITRVDPRYLVLVGLVIATFSLHQMAEFSPNMDYWPIINSGITLGFGLGFVFVPLSLLSFSTLEPIYRTEAAGIYNLVRYIGGSIGISIMVNFFMRHAQESHSTLGESVTPFNKLYAFFPDTQLLHLIEAEKLEILNQELTRQASTIAYLCSFKLLMVLSLLSIPFLVLFKRGYLRN